MGREISGNRAELASQWDLVIPFFAFPESVRRIIYTTNAIEALNSKLRRAVRTRGHFPSDDAALKLLYLVLNHAAADWKRPPREWFEAKTQFAVVFKGASCSHDGKPPHTQKFRQSPIFSRTRPAYLEHEKAKAELKSLVPNDAQQAIGHGVRAKRSKSGAISFDLLSVEVAANAAASI